MNILLFGPPGAGKGTQSANLTKRYGIHHISTGDLFRKYLKENSDWSQKAKRYINAGQYVPDEIVLELFQKVFDHLDVSKGFVLDGFPRTITQADGLSELLKRRHIILEKAIFLTVPHEVLVYRLTSRRICRVCEAILHVDDILSTKDSHCTHCGGLLFQRSDDSEVVVKTRLEVYIEKTAPLIEYYKKAGLLLEIDGQGSEEEVFARIELPFIASQSNQ